ncbi:hypothetical protein VTK56DRAFT_6801 [Thermocarpiscus australiensis]
MKSAGLFSNSLALGRPRAAGYCHKNMAAPLTGSTPEYADPDHRTNDELGPGRRKVNPRMLPAKSGRSLQLMAC